MKQHGIGIGCSNKSGAREYLGILKKAQQKESSLREEDR